MRRYLALLLATPAALPAQVTRHAVVIDGRRITYDATFDRIVLTDSANAPAAAVFYTAYTQRDIVDESERPIVFAYNGGPGSASVMLHIGALGPRRIVLADTSDPGAPPYQLIDNRYSLLDKADLVFVDPVGTGFSEPLGHATGKDFWGVDADVRAQSQFIIRYLTQHGRWNSPRYLLGESYGTTRVVALADYLQVEELTDLNGLILASSAFDGLDEASDLYLALSLPSYAAVAWYHHALPDRPARLRPFLDSVEQFAATDFTDALMAGSALAPAARARVIDRVHRYTGLDTAYLDRADLRVTAARFEHELLRARGRLIGREDARFTGPIGDPLDDHAITDVSSTALFPAFLSAFNDYLYRELAVRNAQYQHYVFNGEVEPWNWEHRAPVAHGWGLPRTVRTNLALDLSEALTRNPRLRVLLNSSYFDLATPYFVSRWTMNHLGISSEGRARIEEIDYESGHAMYVSEPALAELKRHIAAFIDLTARR